MRASLPDSFDFIVVGGGIAGLRAAIGLAATGRVAILTKADAAESNTGYAQGGIAVVMAEGDNVERHVTDTLLAGAGLCDEEAVRVLVGDGPRYVEELIAWGVRFDRTPGGDLVFGLEAAHGLRRILHAGDATGREISRVLWEQVSALPSVTAVNHVFVTEVCVTDGVVSGVRFFDEAGAHRTVRGGRVLLATGGAGQIFRETTNPGVATGDGIALAYRAGARVADLEFVQFHPTALSVPGAPRFLISEALRGEGARLVNARGEAFMDRYHPDGALAPRDVVARGIVSEVEASGGPVFLTLRHLDAEHVYKRFPTIAAMCQQVGVDIARDLIPVGPAAHYMMGGIDTDVWARTSVPGLFAAGETACTGVHGANRLASNSLLEGLVFGARAAQAMVAAPEPAALRPDRVRVDAAPDRADAEEPIDTGALRDLMWKMAGLVRTREGLIGAVDRIGRACRAAAREAARASEPRPDLARRLNLATVARLVARAALRREESRGGHFRADFPSRDDLHWKVHLVEEPQTGS
ncbi:MAG: L-aspartate oxidase [Vicinamibacterales bacterium]